MDVQDEYRNEYNIPRLPFDIQCIVVDHLYSDSQALLACSLVSHEWLGLASYHLFYTTRIRARSSCIARFQEFFEFLQSTPNCCRFIRTLRLEFTRSYSTYEAGDSCPLGSNIFAMLAKLPVLHSLELVSVTWEIGLRQDDHGRPPGSPLLNLRALTLDDVRGVGLVRSSPYVSALRDFLCLFPLLRELVVRSTGTGEPRAYGGVEEELQLSNVPRSLQLDSLTIEGSRAAGLLVEIMRRTDSVQTLKHFYVDIREWPDVAAVCALLRDAGRSLSEVSVNTVGFYARRVLIGEEEDSDTVDFLDFSHCTSLASIAFTLVVHFMSDGFGRPGWDSAIDSLSSLPPPSQVTVQRIEFKIKLYGPNRDAISTILEQLESLDWDALQGLLSRFRMLHNVVFVYCDAYAFLFRKSPVNPRIEGLISSKLPDIMARGLLQFRTFNDD